ncbi:hypothetical protein NARC_40125 [Candidatus Nitrosocosmicus arcticus]|uniref:Uncharacterized protein n=1 Tax=Candidatus Nitrosocosmicus arcticus TaxID=2035267 RepID=A0A557SX34_9ARCH|nr:hypothetical protein NARC_40125 [Candidatus Nitrosocosmicus arcticus]
MVLSASIPTPIKIIEPSVTFFKIAMNQIVNPLHEILSSITSTFNDDIIDK